MLKLISWNVNGVRAAQRKGFLDWLHDTQPDILSIQETKAHPDQLDPELAQPEGYHAYWTSAERKGYSGVALFSREEPISIELGLGIAEYDNEGRTIIADYDDFVLIDGLLYYDDGLREADDDYKDYLKDLKVEAITYLDWKRKKMNLPIPKRME